MTLVGAFGEAEGDLSRRTGEQSPDVTDFAPSEGVRREAMDGGTGGGSDAVGEAALARTSDLKVDKRCLHSAAQPAQHGYDSSDNTPALFLRNGRSIAEPIAHRQE